MNIERITAQLSGVKRTGPGRYIARCPAHNDKSPSLCITLADDKILLKCFSGCEVADILWAIGLEFSDLFPERIKPTNAKNLKFNAYDVLKCLRDEITIILIASSDCANNRTISGASLDRVQLAHSRIKEACFLVWGR